MRVLVLDGQENQAVAAVRSLARAGHTVLVGENNGWSKAGWSRSCSETFRYPSPRQEPQAFLDCIRSIVSEHPGTLVMPMTEASTLPLSASRERILAAGGKLVLPSHEDILRAFDKDETTRVAAQLGIAVPKTRLVQTGMDPSAVLKEISFPLVLKPSSSEESSAKAIRATGRPRYARNEVEFQHAYRDLTSRSAAVLVQEYIEGDGAGYFALMHQGELRVEFAHRRIRDVHPTGSGSAVRISVTPDPQLREASLAILRALRWHGVAMIEFRVPPGKPPVFIEVNGRFWNSLPLPCFAGADFPRLLAEMAEQGDIEPALSYRHGVRCRWFLGDFRHLLAVWRGAPKGFPGKYPKRLSTLLAVLRPVRGTYHDLFTWNDPLPEFGDWLYALQRALK